MKMPSPSNSNFAPPPAGTHIARCYRFIDLGTQASSWQGKAKQAHKVMLSWELPNETFLNAEGIEKPYTVHKRYTWSSHPKSQLRKDLESWRGAAFRDDEIENFDTRTLLDKPCLLAIVHDTDNQGQTWANIASISAPMKGQTIPPAFNEQHYLGLNADDFDQVVFDSLSDNMKDLISKSPEYIAMKNPSNGKKAPAQDPRHSEFLADDIPF